MHLKKFLYALPLILLPWLSAHAEDPLPKTSVAVNFAAKTDLFKVRFSTVVPANVATKILTEMTYNNLTVPSGISFSPSLVASTTNTFGGRIYSVMQIVSGASNVFIDNSTTTISTTSSPYLAPGSWYSPDDPIADQGTLVMKSTNTFTVTGYIWFDKQKR